MQWTEPEDFDGVYEDWMPRPERSAAAPEPAPAVAVSDAPATDTGSEEPTAEVVGMERGRAGWAKVLDQDGYVFYYNETTGVTQWEQPLEF